MGKKETPIYVFSQFPQSDKMKTGGQARLKGLFGELLKTFSNVNHICVYGNHETIRKRNILGNISETWIPTNRGRNVEILNKNFALYNEDTLDLFNLSQNKHLIEFLKNISTENSIMIANHFWFGNIMENSTWKESYLFSHNFESDLVLPIHFDQNFIDFYRQQETINTNFFDKIICCSETDKQKFFECINNTKIDVIVCRNGSFILPEETAISQRKEKKCLYIGSHWPKNVESVTKIIEHGSNFYKNYEINLVGSISNAFPQNRDPNLIFHGILSEDKLIELAEKCSFAINPVFSGGGSNVKNADYLALGLPVLTTNFGLRGYEQFAEFFEIRELPSWGQFQKQKIPISVKQKMLWNFCLQDFINIIET